ncbi:uncharacterized protein LOC134709955 [Mytilus trossulus]|uniref:uncharacterized protein LOC134709955 n=1 Tax=Mytilus trossulus TaxID=6551 RepID=UPI003004F243
MVLARLFPSPLEGTDTSLNLSAFIPYILRCSSSAVLKTRQMSAKALQPLVIGSNVVNVLTDLVHRLPVNRDQVHYSQVHGVLLQIHSVVEILPSLESNIRQQSQQILVEEWLKRTWLVSSLNACHVIKKEALNLTSKLLTEISGDSKPDSNTKRLQHTLFTALAEEQILLTEPYKQAGPGYIEYLTILANLLLYHCSKGDNLKEIRHMGDNLVGYNIKGDNSGGSNMREAIVENSKGDNYLELGYMGDNSIEARLMLILNCCHYEIRMIGLMYVHSVCSDKEEGDDFHVVLECDIPSVDDETVQRTLSSPEVLGKLIQMASDESHFECQKLVFKALTNHPSMQKGSWFKDVIHLIKLFQLCMNFIETCSRDELRSEVIQLTGFLVEPLLKHVSKVKTANDDEVSALLLQWKDMLHYYKGTEQHYLLQVAVIKVLDNNTDLLLKDSTLYWDETTFAFWEILVSLLQEDDQEINEMAAKIVSRLNPKVQVTVHPYLALDLTIGSMLHHHYTRHWKLCVRTMLKWMETDTKEEVGASGRLFDKNEMNTWREDIQFVKIVMKYLIQIILSCNTSSIAGIDNHFSKTENAVTKGDNSTMNNESKGDNLRTDREKLLHLQTELMDKFPVGQKFNLEPITSDQSERWSTILDSLYSHLTLVLKEDLASSGPFKDVNKYIHCSINKLKVDLVIQLCQCLSDSRINSLLQGK